MLIVCCKPTYSQFFLDEKGDTVSYTKIPANDDFLAFVVLGMGDKVYQSYHDTIHHFELKIPDSATVQRSNDKNLMFFRMPKLDGVYDYISVTSFSKDRFVVIDSLVFNNLTKHQPGDYLNGNKQGVFQSATLLKDLTYKVVVDCNDNGCIHQWRFMENDFGYYVVMLAARQETYDQRLEVFENFVGSIKFQ